MTKRFEKAYTALVEAFFNGTLASGSCTACVVGNIVNYAQGGIINPVDFQSNINCSWWSKYVLLGRCINILDWDKWDEALLTLTGYSIEELDRIERAFESNTHIHYEKYGSNSEQEILEDQYNGLVAVVDVLLELDNITPDPKYAAKFREHEKLARI